MEYLACPTRFQPPVLPTDCSEDLRVMVRALAGLAGGEACISAGTSGTAARFLLALCALRVDRPVTLRAEGHLKDRPMAPLIQALQGLGARVEASGGQPEAAEWPLHTYPIGSNALSGPTPEISLSEGAGISSQFTSALLLLAPYMPLGLLLKGALRGVSVAYIRLTLALMQQCGAQVTVNGNDIRVLPGRYLPERIHRVWPGGAADWSCASYLYQWLALSPTPARILIPSLSLSSPQPDAQIALRAQTYWGISTQETPQGLLLSGSGRAAIPRPTAPIRTPMSHTPDLIPTWVVTLLGLGHPFEVTGAEHLRYKESDRIHGLLNTARRCGYPLYYREGVFSSPGSEADFTPAGPILIDPQADHRMAMAWLGLRVAGADIRVADPTVTAKSFPAFPALLNRFLSAG